MPEKLVVRIKFVLSATSESSSVFQSSLACFMFSIYSVAFGEDGNDFKSDAGVPIA